MEKTKTVLYQYYLGLKEQLSSLISKQKYCTQCYDGECNCFYKEDNEIEILDREIKKLQKEIENEMDMLRYLFLELKYGDQWEPINFSEGADWVNDNFEYGNFYL